MRALIQRVHEASVTVASETADGSDTAEAGTAADTSTRDAATGEVVGSIAGGLVALVGVTHDDGPEQARRLADKLVNLRCFDDHDGAMNLSVADVGGEVLVVSQFTLYGDTRKGRRPSWIHAAPPEHAAPLVEAVAARVGELGVPVASGRFRAHMDVALVNDGPVTLLLEV